MTWLILKILSQTCYKLTRNHTKVLVFTTLVFKFNFDNNLQLNKPLKFHKMTMIIRSVFEEDGKLYPQFFLDDTLYELNIQKMLVESNV